MSINFDFDQNFISHFIKSGDGLNLHARVYGQPSNRLPLVCLAGLTRNSIDFHMLAVKFSKMGRQIIALDSRGRGRSDYDANWQNYNLAIELQDALTILASLNVIKAIFIGTSRGGMMTMLLASIKPEMIAGAVLNDIGPALEIEGLRRIQSYVGQMAVPASYNEAIKILKFISNGQFSGLSEEEWQYFVRTTWKNNGSDENNQLEVRYDLSIAKSIQTIDLTKPIPDMWAQFEALKNLPVLSLRGEHSDLFSLTTQQEMINRHECCETYAVAGQAHAPLLADEPTLARIEQFIEKITN